MAFTQPVVVRRNSKCVLFCLMAFFMIVVRAQAELAPRWEHAVSFGGGGSDTGAAIGISKYGEHYVAGSFSTVANFGGKSLTSAGGSDIFLAKYECNGQLLWVLQAGGSGDDSANDLAFDAGGNIYVTGWFVGPASFESLGGQPKTVSGGDETVFVAKYSPAGKLVWLRTGTVGFVAINRGHAVAIDPNAHVLYVAGVSQGETVFSSTGGTTHTVPGPRSWHMFLVKYDLNGNFGWGEWNEASPNSIPHGLALDSDSAYVAGWFEGVATFHSHDGLDQTVTGRSEPVQSSPDYPGDAFVAKYDSQGNLQWVNDIGGYKAIATGIAASSDGRIAVTGFIGNINTGTAEQAKTVLTSQPGGSSINLGGGHFTTPYNRDVFIATYNSAGVLQSARRLGGVRQDGGSGIAYDGAGNLYVAGVFSGTLHVGTHVLTGSKTSNLFVLKFAAGRLAWVKSADGAGTQGFEVNPRLAVDPTGRVWVTGPFTGDATFGGTTLHSTGAEDVFVSELK
jgi:hypothetical protein